MRGQQKSKRVTWASDVNLCQVRLFLSEESPVEVGLGAQDHLQAKISWPLHAGVPVPVSDDNLPPGFEGAQPANLWKNKVAQIPVIKWTRPPSFVFDIQWRVVAGEESNEKEVQKQREMRVLEAIYPRQSSIPPNPSLVPGEDDPPSEQQTTVIPITPIEEEEVADPSVGCVLPTNTVSSTVQVMQSGVPLSESNSLPRHGISAPAVAPDVLAAAQAAITALTADKSQGNLIDHELLIKILSDPKIVDQLVTHQGTSTQSMSSAGNIPNARPQVSSTVSLMPNGASVAGVSNGPFYSGPSRIVPISSVRSHVHEVVSAPLQSVASPAATVSAPSSMPAPVARDINYYKNLIQQHGGERQETLPQYNNRNNQQLGSMQESLNNSNVRDPSKPKIMKPCVYFNSSRGCRHGVHCVFLHDSPSQQRDGSMPEVHSSKRMKMDREITGT